MGDLGRAEVGMGTVGRHGVGHSRLGRRAVVVGMVALVWLAVAAAASAATLHVTSSADGPFGTAGTLRTVVESAHTGDTVVIDPGFDPQLNSQFGGGITIPSTAASLTIEGQGARSTTISGDSFDSTFTLLNRCQCNPTLTITGVTMTRGGGTEGGALFVGATTTATLTADTLSGNAVTTSEGSADGGAVGDEGGLLTLNGVTAVGNSATDGGAIYVDTGTAQINNSTITGNTALVAGGGVYNQGQATLVGDTLAGNRTIDGAGGNIQTNGTVTTGTTTLRDTIVTGGIVPPGSAAGSNCSGPFVSGGHNLESTTPAQCGLSPTLQDLIGSNPLLAPLGDYRGPTDTMALPPGSPAIGSGSCESALKGLDQRGLPRPGAGETGCDIGAYEFQNASASVTCPATAVDQATQCTATVTAPLGAAPAPTGSVALASNGAGTFASGGSCTLAPSSPGATSASCAVAFTPSALGSGSQVITLSYGGDSVYRGASASTTLSITLRPTAVAVTCTPNPAGLEAPTTCSATVTDQAGAGPGPPSGTVTFSGTAGSFGTSSTCMLSGSGAAASCTVPLTPSAVGSKQVTAAYSGDAARASSSASTPLVVRAGPPEGMSVLCAPGSVAPGASTTCTATVDAGADGSSVRATGSLAFSVTGASRVRGGGTCTLAPSGTGAACAVAYTLGSDATGTYDVVATYAGDALHPAASIPTSFATTPVAGKAANVAVVSGTVLIELPSGHGFSPLVDRRGTPVPGVVSPVKGATVAVPMGSTVDTTKGKVALATAASYAAHAAAPPPLQNATLSASIFTIEQMTAKQARAHLKRGEHRLFGMPPTTLGMRTPRRATAKARCHRTGAPGKGVVRAISGTGKGLFRTVGANSITTITNATWIVSDRCDGTLTEIGRGHATVTPIHPTHKHVRPVVIAAGQGVLIKGRFV